jgi:hypothetical protein
MSASTMDSNLERAEAVASPSSSAALRARRSAAPLAIALFIEAALALAFAVALADVAAGMSEDAAIGIRLAAGLSFVVAIVSWALGRRGALRLRRGSYTAAALLQVGVTIGVSSLGLAVSEPILFALLLPAPLLTMLALSLTSVREALGQL